MLNGNKLLDLIYKSMYDNDVLNIMEQLKMQVPILEENYEEDILEAESSDEKIGFEFEELDGYSKNGEPILSLVELFETNLISLPYNIHFSDNYEICTKKIGLDGNKVDSETARKWEINHEGKEILIIISFTSKTLESIEFLQIIENIE